MGGPPSPSLTAPLSLNLQEVFKLNSGQFQHLLIVTCWHYLLSIDSYQIKVFPKFQFVFKCQVISGSKYQVIGNQVPIIRVHVLGNFGNQERSSCCYLKLFLIISFLQECFTCTSKIRLPCILFEVITLVFLLHNTYTKSASKKSFRINNIENWNHLCKITK